MVVGDIAVAFRVVVVGTVVRVVAVVPEFALLLVVAVPTFPLLRVVAVLTFPLLLVVVVPTFPLLRVVGAAEERVFAAELTELLRVEVAAEELRLDMMLL